MITTNYQKFIAAEKLQAKAYKAFDNNDLDEALVLHLEAEISFRELGEISRADESMLQADMCLGNVEA
jgi:hypothetical protein